VSARADGPAGRGAAPPREVSSQALFDGGREVVIVHRGERYRLLLTRQDKLILNK
jgi:hemin uptake protein HemP